METPRSEGETLQNKFILFLKNFNTFSWSDLKTTQLTKFQPNSQLWRNDHEVTIAKKAILFVYIAASVLSIDSLCFLVKVNELHRWSKNTRVWQLKGVVEKEWLSLFRLCLSSQPWRWKTPCCYILDDHEEKIQCNRVHRRYGETLLSDDEKMMCTAHNLSSLCTIVIAYDINFQSNEFCNKSILVKLFW